MRIVATDKTYIDYFEDAHCVGRGLTTRFGLRVADGACSGVVEIPDVKPFTFGKSYATPIELAALPSEVHMVVDDHVLHHPESDLLDVLTGKKSFQDAIASPPRGAVKWAAAKDGGWYG